MLRVGVMELPVLPLTSHPARTSTSAGALALLVALAAGPAYAGTRATPRSSRTG